MNREADEIVGNSDVESPPRSSAASSDAGATPSAPVPAAGTSTMQAENVPSDGEDPPLVPQTEQGSAASSEAGAVPALLVPPPAAAAAAAAAVLARMSNELSPPVPPSKTAAQYEEMDADIKESIQNIMRSDSNSNAPLPPAQIVDAPGGEMEHSAENTEGKSPMPKSEEVAALALGKMCEEEMRSNNDDGDAPMESQEEGTIQGRPIIQPVSETRGRRQPFSTVEPSRNLPQEAVAARPPTPSDDPSSSSGRSSPTIQTYEVQVRLVDDEVYPAQLMRDSETQAQSPDATPVDPWRRCKQALLVGIIVLFTTVVILAALSGTGTITLVDPTERTNPTATPPGSLATLAPSAAPSECSSIIITQARHLELTEYPMKSPVFAIDGENGILVTGSGHILFFLLAGNNEIVNTTTFDYGDLGSRPSVAISGRVAVVGNPLEDVAYVFERSGADGRWEEIEDTLTPHHGRGGIYFGASVDVHGDAIVVGAPTDRGLKGVVSVFLRKKGAWRFQEQIHPASLCSRALFGLHVAIRGSTVVASAACKQSIYIYQMDEKSGDTFLRQDPLVDVFVARAHLTNPIYLIITELGMPSAIDFSNDHYLFLTDATGIQVYHRPKSFGPFTFAQYIEVENFGDGYDNLDCFENSEDPLAECGSDLIADYGEGYLFAPSVDEDLFAFTSGNVVYVFERRTSGRWEESLKIESDEYGGGNNATLFKGTVALSGRSLAFVTGDVIGTYDLEGCTQGAPTISPTSMPQPLRLDSPTGPTPPHPTTSPKPTSVPSLSTHPTSSSVPTASPTKSQEPTSSAAPTKCYSLDVILFLDAKPSETSWDITKVNEDGDAGAVVVTSPDYDKFAVGGDNYEHRIPCLQEGRYEFTIYDSSGDGMCCVILHGSYEVRLSSEETIIAQGGEFGDKETTAFSLP